ncbi:MAG: hypothetical protein HY953_09970, partial [Candidatus Rokubacteria bacterium]|nr:hypothetical protein [Candidatus Rokubacteria bacterium]
GGITVQARAARVYPAGEDACHLVGTVGYLGWETRDGDQVDAYEEKEASGFFREQLLGVLEDGELDGDGKDDEVYEALERKGEFRRDLFGKSGAERAWDQELRGRRGARIVERDRQNRVQRDLQVHPPEHGSDLRLTVDVELQAAVRAAFEAAADALPYGCPVRGAAVVLDPKDGAVLALVSVPGFDPNAMGPPVRKETMDLLLKDPGHPMLHRAIAGQYPPGSTFKVVTGLAMLEEGLHGAAEDLECQGTFVAHRRRFRCTATMGHGMIPLTSALERSCNCYFYQVGLELGPALSRWAEAWGFGSACGIDLAGEKAGAIQRGRGGDYVQMGIGQMMTATPLQVARVMAMVANDLTNTPEELVVHRVSPRLAHPEQAADFQMEITEQGPDADV